MATPEFATGPYRKRLKQLQDKVVIWRKRWKTIAEYLMPGKGRYLTNESDTENKGEYKATKILNNTPRDSLRTLAAGLQGGLTSPARPWFALSVGDKELMRSEAVRLWLHKVRDNLLSIFAQSNFYDSIHGCYEEVGGFGTSAILIEEDFDTIVRYRLFTIGEFLIALDSRYRPDTLYRQFGMTAYQMEERFGRDNMSDTAVTALEQNRGDDTFQVIHCIQPSSQIDHTKADQRGMPYESVHFELDALDKDKFLRRSGYRSKPFVAPRWSYAGTDTYGECPGSDSLGDNQMLQKLERDKLKQITKHIDPPMTAPPSMKGKGATIVPGGVTYVDTSQGGQGFAPAYQPDASISSVSVEIQNVMDRLRTTFFNDLFLSFLNSTKRMTVPEVVEMHEEKMLILGPVLERLQTELLAGCIMRTYFIAESLGVLPEPPPELDGKQVKIEYISTLAQAQKMVGTTSIEKTVNFAGATAAVNPEVLDLVNFDNAMEEYSILVGASPNIIRSDSEVAAIRQARAQAAQRQQALEQGLAMAEGAKTLSEAKMSGGRNALEQVTQGMTN